MADEMPGPSLGEMRAASADLMVARFAASMFPHMQGALKAAADRENFVVRACTLGLDREATERILNAIVEDRLRRGLSHYGPDVYREAMEQVYAEISGATTAGFPTSPAETGLDDA